MTLTIRKYITGTNREPLAGVCFKVTTGDGAAVGSGDGTFYTNSAGEIVIEGLEPGTTVTARKVSTVEGFVLDGEPKTVKIKAGKEAPEMIFWNARAGTLVIRKLDSVTKKPLSGVQFELTYPDGRYVDADNGHLSSKGIFQTDQNGEIRVSVTGTVVAKEVRSMPMNDNPYWKIIHGDSLKLLSGFAPGSFDAVITDPPYASGGRTQAEKNKSTAKKYSSMGAGAPPDFEGDAKDQRSWTRWAAEWLADARRACKPGAPVCMFIDWRQLPAASDALQWAGWIWRGTAVWDKGNSRPQKGRFRQQAEYIVWGSNGDMPINRPVPCLPGVFKYGNPQHRIHLTEKPLQLMRDIVRITEPHGHILDPFAGSGTTVLAAVLEGYQATGIEMSDEYARLAAERIEAELKQAA